MNDRTRFQNNAAFREALGRRLNRIELLEADLLVKELMASPPELVNYYVQLGNEYRDLLSLLMSPTRDTTKLDTETTQAFGPLSSSATMSLAPAQNTPPGQNTLTIANDYYERASDLVNQQAYPRDRREIDKKRIEDAAKATKQGATTAKSSIGSGIRALPPIIRSNKKPYDGCLVQPIAFFLPLILLIFLVLVGSISFYWHIPISVALHIPPYDCESGSITINGSTALMPLMEFAASKYHTLCPGSGTIIRVNPANLPNGSDNGLSQLLANNNPINIATSDTFADTTTSELQEYPAAIAVYALVVNRDVNRLQKPDLSSDQIAAIYSGAITSWSAVNPRDPNWSMEDITLISRPSTSAARAIFERYVLGGSETVSGPPHLISDNDESIADSICNTSGAIGYIPLPYYYDYSRLHNNCLRIVSIDNYDPQTAALVKNDTYQFWSLEHMYTKGPAMGLTQAFINFMYSDTMKSYFDQYDTYGYLSISDISTHLLSAH